MEDNSEYRKNYIKGRSLVIQERYLAVFKGKSKAKAIRLKCLDCCNFQTNEAADCRCPSCPLFEINPYRICRLKREAKQAQEG